MAVLCPESQVPLWQTMNELKQIISYPEKSSARQIAKLIQENDMSFESAICWEASEAAKACQRAGIPQRLGYPAKGLDKCLTDPIEVVLKLGPIEHRVRHYLNLLESLGAKPFVKATFQTPPLQPVPTRQLIALSAMSEYGVTHQWPVENFKKLVDIVESQNGGEGSVDWLILATEESQTEPLKLMLGNRVQDDAVLWDRKNILTKLPYCSALVASDGEVAHMAAHIGLPAVVVFGPNEPEWKRPIGKQSRFVREHVACSPCYLAKCPLDMRCQNEVSVDRVVKQLQEALAERHAG